ncbi:MAG TPA: YbaB/EbfC family nucleoid-associated protein [Anaeromyxobacter sp.]|nr:YbaB/EbfC family nucleoid-associated protein [Anaeromyxobacter sp.]
MDIQYLMRQAKKLEKAMAEAKETLSALSVEAESGGGLVRVRMNGKCEVTRLSIEPAALGASGAADLSMLEDLLTAALNSAAEKARAAADEHMRKATGGIKLPGIAG